MGNVNTLMEEIGKNEILSRSWRVAATGTSYVPVAEEIWRISPEVPFGSPLGGQTAVRGVCNGQERAFWPSWLLKTYPCQHKDGKVVLRGHLLDEKPLSAISLEKLLEILSNKDIKVSSVENIIGLKKTYDTLGDCTGLREEVISIYHWEVVDRQSPAEEAPSADEAPAEATPTEE